MINHSTVKDKLLSDPEVAQAYKDHQDEFVIAQALIKARIAAHMSQAQVAQKMKTSQSQIARLESGNHFPSFQTLRRYAQATNQKIALEISV